METSDLAKEIGKREPFDAATQEACLNILRTSDRIASAFDRLLKQYGLSRPQYNVLRILRGNGRGLSCREVADQMITADPDVTRLVDRLVEAGYAERRRSDADRRVVLVGLTIDGAKLLKRLDAPVSREHDELLGHMTVEELDHLNRLLVIARSPRTAGTNDRPDAK